MMLNNDLCQNVVNVFEAKIKLDFTILSFIY